MPIIGDRPESGVRIAIERPRDGGPPWTYEGAAFLPDATFALRVVVSEDGSVKVDAPPDAPRDLAERTRLIVRAAFKQARTDGEPPAFRIVRWRADPGME